MALPVLVNSLPLLPDHSVVSALTAGMVPTPARACFTSIWESRPRADWPPQTPSEHTPPQCPLASSQASICFDGANVWTADNDNIGAPFTNSQTFTQWDDATLLPITTITLASTTGNGTTSGDCVVWGGESMAARQHERHRPRAAHRYRPFDNPPLALCSSHGRFAFTGGRRPPVLLSNRSCGGRRDGLSDR